MGETAVQNSEIQEKSSNSAVMEAAKALLTASGFALEDVQTALDAIQTAKHQSPNKQDSERKNYIDKTAVYPDVDAYIYKRGDTKTGIWYFRIYDTKRQKPIFKSMKTTDKNKALATARVMYVEIKGKIERGERVKTITTLELVNMWIEKLETQVTPIPHDGITPDTFKQKRYFLRNWVNYCTNVLNIANTSIDKVAPERTRDFGKWLKSKPKETSLRTGDRDGELINNNINEVTRMYHQLAVRDKYLSADRVPQIDRIKYQIDDSFKRDIFSLEQYDKFCLYLNQKYFTKKHNPLVDPKELEKRKIFRDFILIIANAGFRTKELLGMKLMDVYDVLKPSEDDLKSGNMVMVVRRENSKTGRERRVIAPVRKRIDRVLKSYKKMGITHEPNDYIFINPLSKTRGAYGRMIMYQRLKTTLVESGLQEELDKEGKSISPYSFRHFYAWLRILNNVPLHLLSLNMGTSIQKIERTYGHIQTEQHTDVITSGQGIIRRTETSLQTLPTVESDM